MVTEIIENIGYVIAVLVPVVIFLHVSNYNFKYLLFFPAIFLLFVIPFPWSLIVVMVAGIFISFELGKMNK
jgi:hypothetical protein